MVQRKIKVLLVTFSFPTRYNPTAGVFILNQLKELKKQCDIKILFPYAYVPRFKLLNPYYKFSNIQEKELVQGFEVYHPKYLMFPRIKLVKRFLSAFLSLEAFLSYYSSKNIAHELMHWNPDVIHIHSSGGEGLIGVNLKRKYNKPLVLTVHGEDITRHSKKIFSKQLTQFTISNSDSVICVSKFLENEIKNLGIKSQNFFVIPMGANTDRFRPRSKVKARRMFNLPLDKKIILFVGHLVQRKGVDYLIKSMEKIIEYEKRIMCIIIGKGTEEKKLKKLSSMLKLNSYIIFLGQKTNEEVAPYMNACDILVLPSLNEGLPVVLCEALAAGKPVVATNVAGTPELVTKDVGYLVKPKDHTDLAWKIILAVNKKWDVKRILERAEEFSDKKCAKKVVDVYMQILKSKYLGWAVIN